MEILVIDGQGGGLGRQLVAAVKKAVPQAVVTAIGTNSAATSAMMKAGADRAATGAVSLGEVRQSCDVSNLEPALPHQLRKMTFDHLEPHFFM